MLGGLSDGPQNVDELLALRRRTTLTVREAARASACVSPSSTNFPGLVGPEGVWKSEKESSAGKQRVEQRLPEETKSATPK